MIPPTNMLPTILLDNINQYFGIVKHFSNKFVGNKLSGKLTG